MSSRKIGAAWSKKTSDGKTFLSGVIQDLRGDIQIAIFKNDRKEKDNQPDYNIVLSEKREQAETRNDDFFGETASTENQVAVDPEEINDEINVENIPF